MAELENLLVELLRDFNEKVSAVVRRHALESAELALGRIGPAGATPSPLAASSRRGSARPVSRGKSFSPEAVKTKVVSYLIAHPGLRVDQLAERLKLSTSDLKPLVKKLVEARMLRAEGKTRGRRYSAANGATSHRRGHPSERGARPASAEPALRLLELLDPTAIVDRHHERHEQQRTNDRRGGEHDQRGRRAC
jgi:hypothetical protein